MSLFPFDSIASGRQNTPTVRVPYMRPASIVKRGWEATVTGCVILLVLIASFAIKTERAAKRIYSDLSASDEAIHALEVQLAGVRSDIFLSGIYVRNQLLETRAAWSGDQRDSLNDTKTSINKRLERIDTLVPPDQDPQLASLRREIDSYWQFISSLVDDPAGATANGFSAVRRQLRARRDATLAVVEEIGKLNQATYRARHARIEEAEAGFLNYIWTMMAISLALGMIVFIGSGYLMNFLSRRNETQRVGLERAEAELRRLSTDLFKAQEQERKVLSRELHDQVGQTLTALGMELGNIERLRQASDNEFGDHVDQAKRLTQETLKTVRNLAMGLRPAMLDDSGLAPALRYQAREFTRCSGIATTVEINGPTETLPDAYRTCVYRVVQEALTNCARHARANNVRIMLEGQPDGVVLTIEDDGVGLREVSTSGIGLIGIGERTRELNGSVEIRSAAGRGTLLRIELPLSLSAAVSAAV
jgi:signal transduction histidine kinase